MTKIKATLLALATLLAVSACTTYGDHPGDWGCTLVRASVAEGNADFIGYPVNEWHFLWAFSDDGPAIPVVVGTKHEDSCFFPAEASSTSIER